MPIKVRVWNNGAPPVPYHQGPPPTDFGAGSVAHSYDAEGKLAHTIYRGTPWLEFDNGGILDLGQFKTFFGDEVLKLMRLAYELGIEETPESVERLRLQEEVQKKQEQQERNQLSSLLKKYPLAR